MKANCSSCGRRRLYLHVGHSNREIDIDWLAEQPHEQMKDFIERYELGDISFICSPTAARSIWGRDPGARQ